MDNKVIDFISILIRGFFMGTADTIPGVSGGTIALITGIYERLIHNISKINFKFIFPFFKGKFSESFEIMKNEIDFEFFIPLGMGIVIAVLCVSKLIMYLITNYMSFTFAFFAGLILASAYLVFNEIEKFNVKNLVFGIMGLVFAFFFVGLNPIQANHSLIVVFFSGFIAICAMILPGISGAFLLLLLGQYEFMLSALNGLKIPEIITFICGAALGIISFSRVLDYLLKHHKAVTMSFLSGLMLGTLRLPYSKMTNINLTSLIGIIVLGVLGFSLVIVLEKKFNYLED